MIDKKKKKYQHPQVEIFQVSGLVINETFSQDTGQPPVIDDGTTVLDLRDFHYSAWEN